MRTAAVSVLLIAALSVAGCGPSFRRTHESDNAFARCFDFDYDPARSLDEKQECWTDWRADHVYNQPPDKLAYADLRLAELARGVSVPPPPGPPGAFDRRPPPVASAPPPVSAPERPAARCQESCERALDACAETDAPAPMTDAGLAADAGVPASPCDEGYRACMRGCFDR